MNQPSLFTTGRQLRDTTISKHRGSAPSMEANERAGKTKSRDCETVFNFILCRGGRSYLKEVMRGTGLGKTTVSARLSDLKAAGRLENVKGERAEKCGIVRIVKR